MQEIEKVLGHEEVIKHLQNAAAMDKVSHSYIFAGEKGSGKKLLANMGRNHVCSAVPVRKR